MTSTSGRSESTITNDELIATLSDSTRRQILSELALCSQQRNTELDLEDIGENEEVTDRLKVELHHNHLPRLADTELVNWNRETGTITQGEQFEEIEPLVELLHEHQDKLPDEWP